MLVVEKEVMLVVEEEVGGNNSFLPLFIYTRHVSTCRRVLGFHLYGLVLLIHLYGLVSEYNL